MANSHSEPKYEYSKEGSYAMDKNGNYKRESATIYSSVTKKNIVRDFAFRSYWWKNSETMIYQRGGKRSVDFDPDAWGDPCIQIAWRRGGFGFAPLNKYGTRFFWEYGLPIYSSREGSFISLFYPIREPDIWSGGVWEPDMPGGSGHIYDGWQEYLCEDVAGVRLFKNSLS